MPSDLEAWGECMKDNDLQTPSPWLSESRAWVGEIIWAIFDRALKPTAAPDAYMALFTLFRLHQNVTRGQKQALAPPVYASYVYWIANAEVPIMLEMLKAMSEMNKIISHTSDMAAISAGKQLPSGLGSLIIYEEIMLDRFLKQIAKAILEGPYERALSTSQALRREFEEQVHVIHDCILNQELPPAGTEVRKIVERRGSLGMDQSHVFHNF
ncbi:MAG: hypothetical protein Q9216_004506 [Gyalolechia sp. 2 TL-2023]